MKYRHLAHDGIGTKTARPNPSVPFNSLGRLFSEPLARSVGACTASLQANSGDDETDAEKGESSGFRNGRTGRSQETVRSSAVVIPADNLPLVVDAEGARRNCAGHIEPRETPAEIEKRMGRTRGFVKKRSHNLPPVVDAIGPCGRCAGHLQRGDSTTAGHETAPDAA